LPEACRPEWAAPLPKLFGGKSLQRWVFRRGFVEWVMITPETLCKHASRLFRSHPIRHVDVFEAHHFDRKDLRTLAKCRHLERLAELSIHTGGFLQERYAADLLASPHLRNLRALHVNQNPVGDDLARTVARQRHLRGLASLDLMFNALTDAGAAALA